MSNRSKKVKAPRVTKAAIYASFGIEYKAGKILAPEFGWINPVLINGNSKLGKGVWTFSTLAANKVYDLNISGKRYRVCGTCPCRCPGCYACGGCYLFYSTKQSLARKTILAREHLDFLVRAVKAQIIADKITICRIHASGDFFSLAYLLAWKDIIKASPKTVFWTYTKVQEYESAFDDLSNANIVKSLIDCSGLKGLNYGHADYIINLYNALKAAGKNVYICRCGIDKNQHCTTCHGCAINDYVLFLEHGTSYDPEKDPAFPALKTLIESQPRHIAMESALTIAAD